MHSQFEKILMLLLLTIAISACGGATIEQPNISVGYHPLLIPIHVSVDSGGNVSLDISTELVTPIGVFDIGGSTQVSLDSEITNMRQENSVKNKRLLLIRVDNRINRYEMTEGQEFQVLIQDSNTLYKRVNLKHESDGDIILEVESVAQQIEQPAQPLPPSEIVPKVFGAILRGQICNNRCIDYGSTVDFCFRSNLPTQAKLTVHSYETGETFPLGNKNLNEIEQCFTGPMSAPLGNNIYSIESYDGPTYSVRFCVDDCSGDEICENCRIE